MGAHDETPLIRENDIISSRGQIKDTDNSDSRDAS